MCKNTDASIVKVEVRYKITLILGIICPYISHPSRGLIPSTAAVMLAVFLYPSFIRMDAPMVKQQKKSAEALLS